MARRPSGNLFVAVVGGLLIGAVVAAVFHRMFTVAAASAPPSPRPFVPVPRP